MANPTNQSYYKERNFAPPAVKFVSPLANSMAHVERKKQQALVQELKAKENYHG